MQNEFTSLKPEEPENKDAPEGNEEAQESEIEVQARQFGWKPKEEFDQEEKNKGKKWRDAETFMEFQPLYDKLDQSHQRVRTLEKGLKSLAEHNAQIEKKSYEKALKELQEQRKQAIEDQEFAAAENLRDQIDEIKEQARNVQPVQVTPPEPPQELVEWKSQNRWYQQDEDMTVFADGLGQRLASQGYTPSQVLKEVSRKAREAFPHKFRNPNKDSAPEQAGGERRGGGSSKLGGVQMDEKTREIMRGIVRTGIMTEAEYLEQYRKLK